MTTAPLAGTLHVTSAFGPRKAPAKGASTTHNGTDYRAAVGTPVRAVLAGTIVAVGSSSARGKYLRIDHGAGLQTLVQHLSKQRVQKGSKVGEGQHIADSGATGNVSGPHLHFEVHVNGKPIDPDAWLRSGGPSSAPVVPQPTPVAPPASTSRRALVFGSQGDDVRELQRVLNAWYPGLPQLAVDGDYGYRTETRVRHLQQRAGLEVDGKAGPKTLAVLGL